MNEDQIRKIIQEESRKHVSHVSHQHRAGILLVILIVLLILYRFLG